MPVPDGYILDPQVTDSSRDAGDEYLSPSFAQQRLWFLAQLEGVSEAYHVPLRLRLRGYLNHAALQRALDRIESRHEALRTTFATLDGELYQRISTAEDSCFTLLEHDLRQHTSAEEELRCLAEHEAIARFDLEHGPLIRGRLIRLSDDEHVLLLTMHHIVSDGWSMGVLLNELSVLYAAFLRGEDDPLPALEIQYADYAVWHRQWIKGERLEQQTEYWRGALAGAPALLELPTDHPRPVQQDYTGAFAELQLDATLTAGLRELSHRHGSMLYMTLMAGWATLLSRLSGQTDVVIGTPVANRGREEIENLIGFFVNTLALRIDLSTSPTVKVLLEQVKRQVLAAQQHQDIPFEQVVEIMRPVRSLAHSPLFQVVFAWNNPAEDVLTLPGLELQLLSSPHGVVKFDMTLSLQETGRNISGGIAYATSLFEQQTIERYLGYFRTVLEAMVADDTLTVDRLPLLSASERHQLLYAWNATQAEFPADKCVHELFEEQVERTPDAVAVVFEGQKLTYATLNARANRLVHKLIERSVKSNERVVTLLERSIDLIVAQLAILKAGAAYVPLDPQAPAMRHAWIVEDCAASLIITDARTEFSFAPAAPVLRLGDGVDAAGGISTNPEQYGSRLRVAYVMYTSGSTGTPKGVLVPHRAVARLVINNEYAVIGADDRVAFAANPSFDASTFELWAPLLNGGTVVVIRHDTVVTPQAFIKTLQEERINVLWLTVGLFNQLAEALEPVFAQFKVLITGGDVLDPRVIARVWSNPRKRPERLLNAYGPTETTTFATTYEIGSSQEENGNIPIGRPIANTRIYLLDSHGEPVPLGAVGEIYIGGAGVALGYLNRPELTSERFLVDRFSGDPDARMYRTGDLARYLPDGNLMFVSRNDNQVKIRGFRIELGEIEGRLMEHPAVREAVVLTLAKEGEKRLVAYVVTDHEDQLASRLHAHLAARLPEYMVPAAFVRLDALPLTRNGKLDRGALPSPDDHAYARSAYEAPQGETETALAAIWSDLLGLERISRNDNFFNLGGHSFLALRVISEIHKSLKLHVSVPTFFLRPTIAGVAKELEHGHAPQTKPKVATFRAGAAGLPIYFMGARPEEFRLAQLIDGDRRICAVDVPILASWLAAFAAADIKALPTIDQLGAHFGEILAEHAGSSPCVIAGYSLGGKIAFEAARVLQRAGGNVAFVLLLDARAFTWSSYTLGPALGSLARIWRGGETGQVGAALSMHRLRTSLSESWTLGRWLLSRMPNSVKNRVDRVKNRLGQVTQRSAPEPLPSGHFDEEGKPIDNLLFNQFALLLGRLWCPRPLDAAGVLIRADNSENILPGSDPAEGWGGLFTRGLEIVQTTGDHHSMVTKENAASLALQMNLILDRYEAAQNAQGGALVNNTDQRVTDGRRRFEPAPADPERRVV